MTFADWLLKSLHYAFVPAEGGLFSLAPDLWPVYMTLGALLAVIAVVDARWKTIPHVLTMPGIAAGLVLVAWFRYIAPLNALFACGAVAMAGTSWNLHRERRRQRILLGGGSVMMLAMVGAFLGVVGLAISALVSSLLQLAMAKAFPRLVVDEGIESGPWLALAAAGVALHHL